MQLEISWHPKKSDLKRTRPSSPWYTQELRQKKLGCEHEERKWCKGYSENANQNYKASIKEYKELVDKTKKYYFVNKINSAKSSPKELFRIVTSLVQQPEPPTLASQELCEEIAKFFFDKVETIFSSFSNPIPSSSDTQTKEETTSRSVFEKFRSVLTTDILELLISQIWVPI